MTGIRNPGLVSTLRSLRLPTEHRTYRKDTSTIERGTPVGAVPNFPWNLQKDTTIHQHTPSDVASSTITVFRGSAKTPRTGRIYTFQKLGLRSTVWVCRDSVVVDRCRKDELSLTTTP